MRGIAVLVALMCSSQLTAVSDQRADVAQPLRARFKINVAQPFRAASAATGRPEGLRDHEIMSAAGLSAVSFTSKQLSADSRRRVDNEPSSHRVALVTNWTDAVRTHDPGTDDGPAYAIAGWTNRDIKTLWLDVQTLIRFARCPTCGTTWSQE